LSKQTRVILDEEGKISTKIFVSGDLNEHRIAELLARGARIDSFGVGTELTTSYDAPALSAVYKLAGIEDNGRVTMKIKLSHDKATYPGPKQVWRVTNRDGKYVEDRIALADEDAPSSSGGNGSWRPLLEPAMTNGQNLEGGSHQEPLREVRDARHEHLDRARQRAMDEMKRLPDDLLALKGTAVYRTTFSDRLIAEREAIERTLV